MTQKSRKPWTALDAEQVTLDPSFVALGASWKRSLLAANMAPQTVTIYLEAHQRLGLYLAAHELTQDVRELHRADIEGWVIHLFAEGYAAASVSVFYRGIHRWFTWLEEEEEISASPTRHMKPPIVPDDYRPMLTDAQVKALLAACHPAGGMTFADHRDLAILMLLFDTGMRRSELASITVEQLNLDEQFVVVAAKGRRDRVIAFGKQSMRILDKYLRQRARQEHAALPWVFIGQRGRFTGDGVHQMLQKRAALAGITGIHPHMFRRTYTHLTLEAGMQESDLMEQMGWSSSKMVRLYGAALRSKRAREVAKKLSPADRMASGQ